MATARRRIHAMDFAAHSREEARATIEAEIFLTYMGEAHLVLPEGGREGGEKRERKGGGEGN